MSSWVTETLVNSIKELESERELPGWFDRSAIANVPFIPFPGFSDEQLAVIWTQSKEVLRQSKMFNHYREVAITYDSSLPKEETEFLKVFGDKNSVDILDDPKTAELVFSKNKQNSMVVISLHNHPNTGSFSVSDLLVFSKNPCIKLMIIVNKEGEAAFLLKTSTIDLSRVVSQNIEEAGYGLSSKARDYLKKIAQENSEPHIKIGVSDFLEFEKRRAVVSKSIKDMVCGAGVVYGGYMGRQKAEEIFKRTSESGFLSQETDIEYFPNEEDGDYEEEPRQDI